MIWDVSAKRAVASFSGVRMATAFAFSPDGKQLALAAGQQGLILVETEYGRQRNVDVNGLVYGALFGPNSQTLYVAHGAGVVSAVDVAKGVVQSTINVGEHIRSSMGMEVSPDGRTLVTVNPRQEIKLWDASSGRELAAGPASMRQAASVTMGFSPDSQTLALAGPDNSLRLFSPRTGKEQLARVTQGPINLLSFLKDALTQNVAQAVARRGGFRELVSRGEEGPIGITIKFRESSGRLATYSLDVASDEGRPVVAREILKFRRGQYGQPWHFVDFSRGRGTAITNEAVYGQVGAEAERREYVLDEPSVLAIKGLGQFKEFRVVAEFRSLIENWHISDFHIAEARPSAEAGYAEHLSTRGDNVAQVAQYLYEHHRDRFDRVLEAMRQRVPGVRKVEARPTEDGRLVLRFQDGAFKDPFIARYVSDGTIKMFAYLVLLYDPKPHPLLAVEEPENQLYTELLAELVEEFRDYARRGGQMLISTHSPEFLNGCRLDEIYWLVKDQGFATVRRAADSELLGKLVQEGDLPGALWKQGLFEGAGVR
jgi:predicted ATPase